uniref:Uncharacterized protein n=1 Tax=Chromera velia CCMP2878 TaxID=1169474 RepID=A0A0G4FKL5_9ALVE|mmetsp:Transcript_15774/g.31995  ORF Transcript_15774/g.31995 Transcript_15774/m.31995 type:complete len:261 (-) Transcript_15774:297-1079(-)|eukprot:Cvel_17361.t1-p1 / transcript=Cvel_17361.t1 / gene=Cvel_17361 / organism=Chromera_velia_CCMP2878 / gene_product=3-oxoacyl-[acyl-carrier-protein] reductase FabG, putative / transcript_product=3-oxoacyl-[acyl-carrier-protein] reductase FabG, putative / location=Cvel_scaffold1379:35323-36102(+) / protein_length=260 / sequence_SO=supercontig / SO=protein_coding / is_pseudo=false
MSLEGKVAIVSGSSRGLGAEICRAFVKEGCCVVVNYFNSKETAEALVRELVASRDGDICAVAAYGDVRVKGDMDTLAQTALETFKKGLHIAVANALVDYSFDPGSSAASIETVSWEQMDAQVRGTVQGALNLVQAVLPEMKRAQYGKLVFVGTNLVYNPVVTYYDYICAKAALVSLMRNAAAELGPVGIRSNLLAGGLLDKTDASSKTTEEVFQAVASATPLRKTTTVEEFAAASVFFASSASDPLTGQCVSVDGGLTFS